MQDKTDGRISWPPEYMIREVFDRCTREALQIVEDERRMAESGKWPPGGDVDSHAPILDLFPKLGSVVYDADDARSRMGASYASLDQAAALVGMNERQQVDWYELCEAVGITERHAACMIESATDDPLVADSDYGAPVASLERARARRDGSSLGDTGH